MTTLVAVLLLLQAIPVLALAAYLLLCTLLSRRLKPPPRPSRRLRFDVIVPAHDEAAVILGVLRSLDRLDWPVPGFRVRVVADNCSDRTAALARRAGADVLERHSVGERGKGHALAHGFADSAARGWADAVVVVDADSEVAPGLLEAFAARIEQGAGAVQAHYGVLNAQASWRTRMMAIALACFHQQRSRARERLALSCGIRGNGWCVTHELLREVPYRAFSLTEDLEFGIALGLAGHRVHYADEATVSAAMVSDGTAARTQRQRWEHGRWQMVRSRLGRLVRSLHGGGAWVRLDLALDLLMPPLSHVALAVIVFIASALAAHVLGLGAPIWIALALLTAAGLLVHVLRGWQLSGVGPRGLFDLLRVPAYVAWKILIMVRPHDASHWVRTRREGH